jgi:tRNA threonylcarbamoyladenosine biosynthesis protein TsaE
MPLTIACPGSQDTVTLGRRIGAACRCGVVITLNGALGSGKTTLVQGLASGLDVPEAFAVTSPSYTLINEYPGRIGLAHADLYRLAGAASIDDIGLEALFSNDTVLAIEWPERLPAGELRDHLCIRIDIRDDDSRRITMNAYGLEPTNLLEAVSEIYQ